MIRVRFMSLVGKFTAVKTESFDDTMAATSAVAVYIKAAGFDTSTLKLVEDDDPGSFRFTATTPGGRGGRNVAFGEDDCDYLA